MAIAQKPQQVLSPPVTATGNATGSRYCIGDADFMFAVIELDITVRNTSTEAIVLDAGAIRVIQTSVSVAKPAKPVEPISVWQPTDIVESGSTVMERLVVLEPGEERVLRREATFLFSLPGKTLPGVASAPGLYRLLVDLSTWRSGAPEARQWADKLAKRGRLWTAPVSLSPVPFEVPANPEIKDCRSGV